jgi:hypothetical protein
MKIEWEESDITCGRRVSSPSGKETFLIGYAASTASQKRFVTVSLLDGMVTDLKTKLEVAKVLNDGKLIPIELLRES